MKNLVYLAIFFLPITLSRAQVNEKVKRHKEPDFATTAEQEDYWTKQIFKFEYKKQHHERFSGPISRVDSSTFKSGEIIVRHSEADKRLILMFEKGILVPWTSGLTIHIVDELPHLNPSFKVKRFRLSVHHANITNPSVYFIELTNPNADSNMDTMTFIEGSALTFLKQGWLML
jgi:hypothetical protein